MREQPPYGLEIITEPYTYADLRPVAQKVAHFFGHVPQNPRTSIHIHVDASGETWPEIRNLFLWARALEAIIYRVSCAGDTHRGCKLHLGEPNNHKFARPLSAPIGVNWSNGKIEQLIDWTRLTEAASASEFVASWGRLDQYWNGGFEHYMPHRLHCINLASLLRTGTIEWRVFDGLYQHFDLLVDFVYSVHALASSGQTPDFQFDLGTTPNVDAAWVSNLLGMDIAPLWGQNWQQGCRTAIPLSHYPHQPVLLTHADRSVLSISNGRSRDIGARDFPLFLRGAR